jgi:hypothetical protein
MNELKILMYYLKRESYELSRLKIAIYRKKRG